MNEIAGTSVVPIKPPAIARVRVKLRRATDQFSKVCPPDGQGKVWWERLKRALGTTSSDFVNATLVQIQNASRLPSGGVSETSVNAVLAFPGYSLPAVYFGENWGTASIGTGLKLAQNVTGYAAFNSQFAEDNVTIYGGQVGVNVAW